MIIISTHVSSHHHLSLLFSSSKFRTKRRHSIAPLPAIRLNDKEIMVNADSDYDAQSVNSAAPSITSVTSLASLLREKMQVSRVKTFFAFFNLHTFFGR